jgi:sterol desaturase/sphingolipid hydroxylase (fatty acid hydroxylase superfamily)
MQGYPLERFSLGVLDAIIKMSRTRANYWLEFILDGVLGVLFLSVGLRGHTSLFAAVLLVFLGLFVFSFMEYCFHRWVFHGRLRLLAQGHAAHHGDPTGYDSLPFFLPALILFVPTGLGALLLPVDDVLLLASGIAFGYVAYGLSHFVIHHKRFRPGLARKWAASHHIHHHHPDCNFGVTTPLWDIVLGTRYVSSANLTARGVSPE